MLSEARVWLRRVRGCTGAELLLLIEAEFYLAVGELSRLTKPVGEFMRGAQAGAPRGDLPLRRDDLRLAARVGWAVTRAARYGVIRSKCLVRSLAIQSMLRRRGIRESELRIGVRLEDGKLLAHAWIELHGAVVGDSPSYVSSFRSAPNLSLVRL